MLLPFFIYAKNLSDATIQTMIKSQKEIDFIGQTVYLEYKVAFFRSPFPRKFRASALALGCDFAELSLLPQSALNGLLVMDMDSTAIQIECIDELAKLAGTGKQVAEITEKAMRGELDFTQSLYQRVRTLAGASTDILQKVEQNLPLTLGLEEMITHLQSSQWKIAIASGGFTHFAEQLKQRFHLDRIIANQLEIINGQLTGNVIGEVVDAQKKADTLLALSKEYHIPIHQCVAIGDGANDLAMLNTAGVGIAFHAKPKVQEQAQITINFGDLSAVVLLLHANELFKSLK